MNETAALIERERRKLAWLRDKVVEQEKRVSALALLTADDPLDEMFDREVGTPPSAKPSVVAPLAGQALTASTAPVAYPQTLAWLTPGGARFRTPRRLPENWVTMFEFIGTGGKSLKSIESFIQAGSVTLTPGAARAGLMHYRKEFGLIASPQKGFYQVTERGIKLLESLKDESPAVREASESIPT
jgi:hypothetical protein